MISKARLENAKGIQKLVTFYAEKDFMLPRSLNEIYENIRDYWICQENDKIIG